MPLNNSLRYKNAYANVGARGYWRKKIYNRSRANAQQGFVRTATSAAVRIGLWERNQNSPPRFVAYQTKLPVFKMVREDTNHGGKQFVRTATSAKFASVCGNETKIVRLGSWHTKRNYRYSKW